MKNVNFTINFILLSSKRTVNRPDDTLWNYYLGLDLPSGKQEEMMKRLINGDDFFDLVEQTKQENRIIRSRMLKFDDWKDL